MRLNGLDAWCTGRRPSRGRAGSAAALLLAALLGPAGPTGASASAAQGLAAAAAEHRAGQFEEALARWDEAERQAEAAGDADARARALLGAGQTYLALGRAPLASVRLARAHEVARAIGDPSLIGEITAALGNARALAGDPDRAREALEQAQALGRQAGDRRLVARTTNDLARLAAARGESERAAGLYREARQSAREAGDPALEAIAAVNLARVLQEAGRTSEAAAATAQAERLARALPASHVRSSALTGVGRLYAAAVDPRGRPGAARARAASAFQEAARTARDTGDRRALSYALGYHGALEEATGRPEDALTLTREAAQQARVANAPESLYRWQWQAGRLLRRLGDDEAALAAYRVAVGTLDRIRQDLATAGRTSFREQAGPVYVELADLLVRRAERAPDPAAAEPDLLEARRTVEALKGAELEDYFQDDCVAALRSKTSGIDALAGGTAALYPLVLPGRLAILVSLPDGLRVRSTPVGEEALEAEVNALRRALEKRTTREYLRHARQVYDWLVRPVEGDLAEAGVRTLVFVPDGVLRTIPLAALHDGSRFLVERYAVATSPGLTLTDPRPLAGVEPRVLAAGLTQAVQGFPPLPAVRDEIAAVDSLFPGTVLEDETFQAARFGQELGRRPYTIVHVASHGEFGRSGEETFLLTHDSRITLDELEAQLGGTAYREQPVELLTLSACQTAAGDDRAALGLAGVAVKAGARSAVATLWSVSDAASSSLVTDFYRHLRQSGLNKAEALREAQTTLMADRRYRHPYYWSPFLLIGNWL